MIASVLQHRALWLVLFLTNVFANSALAAQDFQRTGISGVRWQHARSGTEFSAPTGGSEPTGVLAAANLPVDSYRPLLLWGSGMGLAGGLVAFVLCRKVRKRTQELSELAENYRHSEEELKRSNEKLKTLIESAPLAIIALDREGKVDTWNPEAEKMFGWSEQEVLGRPLAAVPAERWTKYQEIMTRLQSGEVIQGRVVRPQRKDGALLTASLSVSPLYNEDGNVNGCMAIVMDITQHKQTTEALRASEERYRELFENAKDMICTRDLEGNLTSVNREFERITGYTREELIGMNITQLAAPEYRPFVKKFIGDINLGISETTLESEVITKEGRRVPVEVSARVICREGKPVGVQSIARDLSQHKQLLAQLLQAQKMEAIGRLAGGVAHDFNNLLNVISGYSEMLLEEVKDDSILRHYAEEIRKAADRAADVTRQLLAFSRKQVLQPKMLDLNDFVTDLGKMLRRLIGEDIQFSTVLQPALGLVKADPAQLEQAILNLAVNARDAMPQGGRLTIETGNVELDEAYAHVHPSCQPGSYVLLAVSDTGVGMDAQTRSHIFEPFFTTKPLGKGTGLGLATVYGIVEQSGGYIWVYSEPGHGTTFKIYLPRVGAPEEVARAHGSSIPLPRGSETVLIVEDAPAVRELAREFLESSGYQVFDVESGAAALELVKKYPGPIHLLLTDVIMPRMSGRELAEQVVGMRLGIRVLYMSGYTDDMIANHGILEEGTHFLQKPFTLAALARKVREVLEEQPRDQRSNA